LKRLQTLWFDGVGKNDIKLVDPTDGYGKRADRARRDLSKYLGVSRSLLFRDVARFPKSFALLLLTFLALGWSISLGLIYYPLPIVGILKGWFAVRLTELITALIPAFNIGIINLANVETAFEEGGRFLGTMDFVATLACIALEFYLALAMYWGVKQSLALPHRAESRMVESIEGTPRASADSSTTR
jgi:hypothetical protein